MNPIPQPISSLPAVVGAMGYSTNTGLTVLTARKIFAGWSSLVARPAHNQKVVGSNPIPATNPLPALLAINHVLRFFPKFK